MKIFEFLESSKSRNVCARTFYGHAMEQSRTFHRMTQCNKYKFRMMQLLCNIILIEAPRMFWNVWKIYMLFAGREVRVGKNCARGRGRRPRAVFKTEGSHYGPT